MHVKTKKNYFELMQDLVQSYIDAGEPWPAPSFRIAQWAIRNGHWQPRKSAAQQQCARDISRALREEYITDAKGRSVRAKHAARIHPPGEEKQMTFWADIRTASHEHMEIAFQQRRMQIVGDCTQLKTDVESFNDNHPDDAPIQMVFDFRDDLIEAEQPRDFRRIPR